MAKPYLEPQLEAQHEEAMDTLIPRLLQRYGGSQLMVALELGVSQAWLSRWLKANGYVEVKTWIRQEQAS